ncbi:exopolysaccharide production repressor protein [Chelativorans salis]|uniref:Exopolysaccharide production repressor protein n=1 Tax=Chelativorans salis TaxID=2978478 RepID=A0ABT2LTI1_9HYPH|nr:exopolysaccharide production repressor protein [Chelativorans sp. EGI FJ00035]MCT7377842.1 exopolysaccharide production repressor protein [Chelativorans sp. EGI FJ00035]
MSFPLFLRGMLIALTAFAITTYIVTQSAWTTFLSTLACAVIIQTGYFATILIMVLWPSRGGESDGEVPEGEKTAASMKHGKPVGSPDQVSGVTRSSQL